MRISDWSSDVCSSDLLDQVQRTTGVGTQADDIAGVGRDLRLMQHDIEHAALSPNEGRNGRRSAYDRLEHDIRSRKCSGRSPGNYRLWPRPPLPARASPHGNCTTMGPLATGGGSTQGRNTGAPMRAT